MQIPMALVLVGAILLGIHFSKKSNTPFDTMKAAVESGADLTLMQEADNQMFKRIYGLDANDYENVLLYYPVTNMGVEEVLLVKVSSQEQLDAVKQAVEARLAAQLKSFDGYGVEQCEMLNNAIVHYDDSYVVFSVGKQAEAVENAYLAAYKGQWSGEVNS